MSSTSKPTLKPGTGSGGCPVLHGYDPLDPEELRNPEPSLRIARKETPVFFDERYGFWSISRYEDIMAVINDDENFSNKMAIPMPKPPEDLRERMPVYPFETALLFMDNPEHRPSRLMVQEPFIPRRLKAREPLIYEKARTLIEAKPDRRMELLKEYSLPLALTVIGDLVGVPEPDWPMLEESVFGAFEIAKIASGVVSDPAEIRRLAEGQAAYWEYLVALAEERRRNPTDDFSSVLAAQVNPEDGSHFSAEDIAGHINTMLGAGFETSAQLITFSVHAILNHRDHWELLKSDRSLLQGAVEECVRWRAIPKRIFRLAKNEVEIGGVTIPEGALIALLLGSANHDDEAFEEAEVFDIRRPSIPGNLSFGRGMHFCLGAPLAKTEVRITLETLLELAPEATIEAGFEPEWNPDIRLESLKRLPLDLGPVPA
jgi:cytochrome P450